jgi:hypothetical protein
MKDMSWMVQLGLQGPINMGETRCRAAEAHSPAQVVAPLGAKITIAAVYPCLDGDALANRQIGDTWADSSDDACGLVTKDEGSAYGEVSIAAVRKIMEVTAAQTCGDDLYLDMTCGRGPYVAILYANIAGTVEDG